jgi:hypothetical protein
MNKNINTFLIYARKQNKLRGLSPRAIYTNRATAAPSLQNFVIFTQFRVHVLFTFLNISNYDLEFV